MVSDGAKGVIAMVAASAIWGLSPLYFKLMQHIPPLEILVHRVIWSALLFVGLLALQRRLPMLGAALRNPARLRMVLLAALTISANWLIFLTAIQTGHTVEASLGYYIFPLVSVLLGWLVMRESLSAPQGAAVALAAAAVVVLTIGLGVAPWIALGISGSFGLYGLIKKRLDLGPVVSVTAEVVVLAPLAGVILAVIHRTGTGAYGGALSDSLLLMLSGVLTAVPLILFSYASRRTSMATIGLVQYLNPTLQFACAVLVFAEPFGRWHGIAFGLIWAALAIYTAAGWRRSRTLRSAAMAAATSGTVLASSSSEGSAKP